MMAKLGSLKEWLVVLGHLPAVVLCALMVWAGEWLPVALFFSVSALLMYGVPQIEAWRDRRVLADLRRGIKRPRGKSVIPSS